MITDERIKGTESYIHRLSPISKLIAVLLFWITAMLSFNPLMLTVMIVISLVLWVIAKLDLRKVKPLLVVSLSIGAMMLAFNSLFFARAKTVLFYLPIVGWPVWLEGALFGGSIALKIMAVVVITPIMMQTTPMPSFMAGLAKLKVPYKVAFTFGMAFRLVPIVSQTFKDITESQKMRGHDVNNMKLKDKITKGYFPLVIPLVLTLLRRSQDLDIAIESRAFGSPTKRTFMTDIGLKSRDWVFLTVFIALFVAIYFWVFYGGGLTQTTLLRWGL